MMDTMVDQDRRVLSVNIKLDHARKRFTFDFAGEWRGRDVKYVMNHIFREYRGHMRRIRMEHKEEEALVEAAVQHAHEQTEKASTEAKEKLPVQPQEEIPKKKRTRKKTEDS